jgi:hypothetical protein
MTTDVQILNTPLYRRVEQYEAQVRGMIDGMELLIYSPQVDPLLAKGILTNLRMSALSMRSAMKQMRGEIL